MGPEDYPYEPCVRVEDLEGLDKLRAIENREYAAVLYELFWVADRNDTDDDLEKRDARRAKRQGEDYLELLTASTHKALSGKYGKRAQMLADEITRSGALMGIDTMRLLRGKLRKLEGRECA